MDKQDAIHFILQRLEQDQPAAEIALELSQQLNAPYEVVNNFVGRVVRENNFKGNASAESRYDQGQISVSSNHEIAVAAVTSSQLEVVESKSAEIIFPILDRDRKPVRSEVRVKIWLQSSGKRFKDGWRVFYGNKLAVLGLVMLCGFVILAILHPILMGRAWSKTVYDPETGYDMDIFPHPSGFSARHLLGTDTLGRDVLSVLMAATGPSLAMAFVATVTASLLGTMIGAVSAFYRGLIDGFFSGVADISLLAPAPLVMVIIGFVLNITPVQFGFIYGILAGLGVVAIVLRSHALDVVSKSYIQAAQVAGGSPMHILLNHVFPHLLPLAAVSMLFTVTGAIFASGFIAFLGLSRAQLNWGSMIYDAFTYEGINGILPWNVLIPSAMAISLFAASFYLVALGLQDVVEPRKAGRRLRSVS